MPTTIELNNGTVLKVHESVAEVKQRLAAASSEAEFVRFSSVTGTKAEANRISVVDVRDERF